MDSQYIKRCHKRLKEWDAPMKDWFCIEVLDMESDNHQCELCSCKKVRFIHVMAHDDFYIPIHVGCICAGIMEDDILAAKDRDRKMKNRATRRRNFPYRKWKPSKMGGFHLMHKGKLIHINEGFDVGCNGVPILQNGKFNSFLSAAYAAFDVADPVKEVL